MKVLGRILGIALLVVGLIVLGGVFFISMRSFGGQIVAAPPTPAASVFSPTLLATTPPLNPTLLLQQPTARETPTVPPVFPTVTPTHSPSPFPTPAGPPPTIGPSRYVSKEVVIAPVGSGPGEVGVKAVPGEPMGPTAITLDVTGSIFVLDRVNARINKYNSGGVFIAGIPISPEVRYPRDLAIDAAGALYILDGLSDKVLRFTQAGQLVKQYGSATQCLEPTSYPRG